MRRFTSMKVGLAGILSCLALLFGLFATTSTASAHTANDLHPNINVFDVSRFGNCLHFRIEGNGFTPHHHADLSARSFNGGVSIDPDRVRVNGNGEFATGAQVCGLSFGEFSNCGDFIDSPDFFCGVNLNPQEFCPLSEFDSEQFCLNLSALRPLSQQDPPPCPPGQPLCFPSGGNGPPDQGQEGQQGQGQPQFPQGQNQGEQQGQPQDQHHGGQSPCEVNPLLCNPQGQPPSQPDQPTLPTGQPPSQPDQPMPQPDQPRFQPPPQPDQPPSTQDQSPCQRFQFQDQRKCHPQDQFPCQRFQDQQECNFHHFHFHRVRVFEFCRFHFFSFCHFRFRNRTITIFIRAFDEFTGRHSDTAEISFG